VDQAAARWARKTGLTFQGSSASRASAVFAFGSSSSRCSRYAYGSSPFTRAQATYRFALEAAPQGLCAKSQARLPWARSDWIFQVIVVHRHLRVLQVAYQFRPLLQGVRERLAERARPERDACGLRTQAFQAVSDPEDVPDHDSVIPPRIDQCGVAVAARVHVYRCISSDPPT
jgi:hypothetical protein